MKMLLLLFPILALMAAYLKSRMSKEGRMEWAVISSDRANALRRERNEDTCQKRGLRAAHIPVLW